ncbi:MAG: glycosyltransferase [Solirubrobacteraceae bacterium]
MARALATSLRERDGAQAVELRSDLEVMGERFGRFMKRGLHVHLDQIGQPGHRLRGLSYELAYRAFFERAVPRQAAQLALAVLGGRGLRRTIADFRADVVVTEYPVLSAALGQLRALGRLRVPVCSSISDPAGLWYWAHPGIDLHLLSWPESLPEVERIAGTGSAVAVRPLIDERILNAPPRSDARVALNLPEDTPVLLVSGGGWAVGDLLGATQASLRAAPDSIVICLAGRSSDTQTQLLARLGDNPHVRILGFTDQMPELLAAADTLVHTTGGTTALEARIVGCPLINYGTSVSHVRAHARAMAEQGLAEWAPDQERLVAALKRTLDRGPQPPLRIDTLPEAADLVLQLARGARFSSSSHVGRGITPACLRRA